MIPSEALVRQKRQALERRLDTLVEMAERSPDDAELVTLIGVVRNNLARHDAHPQMTGQIILNTDNLVEYHIHKRREEANAQLD